MQEKSLQYPQSSPDKEKLAIYKAIILSDLEGEKGKSFSESREDQKKYLDIIFNFIAEAAAQAALTLNISTSSFNIIFSSGNEGVQTNVIQRGEPEKLITAAEFSDNGPYNFFVTLHPARLMHYAELMRMSPFRRQEVIKTLVEEVGHEMYHGYQHLHSKGDISSIPDPEKDFQGYMDSPEEESARGFGTNLSDHVSKQSDFLRRLL